VSVVAANWPGGGGGPARFQERSSNSKLSPVRVGGKRHWKRRSITPIGPFVSSTYVSIEATCSPRCPFKGDGCYVDSGYTRVHSIEMNRAARGMTAEQVIAAEVELIDGAFRGRDIPQDGACGGRDLRLHVGGDVGNDAGAAMLNGAAYRWRYERRGGSIFTYTHAWRTVRRTAWQNIAVLASVEKVADIARARARGYAAAIVVPSFPLEERPASGELFAGTRKAFRMKGTDTKVVPCPAQTGDTTCVECRLCIDRDLLAMNVTIAFAAHGMNSDKVRRSLPVIR